MMPTGQMPRRDVTGARIGAWFIDIIILSALSLLFIVGMEGIDGHTYSSSTRAEAFCEQWEQDNFGTCSVNRNTDIDSPSYRSYRTTQVKWVPVMLTFGMNLIAYPLLQGLTGATPGKALVGLRVVQRNGRVCGVGRSFLRHILWVADAIICGLPIVGGAVMLSTQQKQRVGDLAAGTFVVHRSELGRPIQDQVWGVVAPPPMTPGPYGTSGHPGFQPGAGTHGWAPPPVPPAQPSPGPAGGFGTSPGWGEAPGPTSAPGGYGPATGPAPAAPGAAADGPTWDAARGTYIQYDPALGAWMQWNDTTKAWESVT